MKKIIPLLILLLSFANIKAQSIAFNETTDFIVQLSESETISSFLKKNEGLFERFFLSHKSLSTNFGIYLFSFSQIENQDDFLLQLKNAAGVKHAQLDSPIEIRSTIPNDPLWPGQWHFEQIGLDDVWDVTTGGSTANGDEIVVAVLDSGFDLTHEDLEGNIWENKLEAQGLSNFDDDGNGFKDDINGWNFINDTPTLSVTGHGTSVSGIIGANGDNSLGITGVNWDVKMMFLTIDLVSEVIAAFDYIIYQRELYNNTAGEEGTFIVVTNGSFGKNAVFCAEEPMWGEMYDKLGEVGVLSVAATANENWDVDEVGDMPTTCTSDFLITVTATDMDDVRASNAAFGPTSIDVAAPGRNISALTLQDKYTNSFGGTSSSCPHVTGAIALLYSLPCVDLADLALSDPAGTALLMKRAILESVLPLPSLQGKIMTGGRMDVYESMKYLHAFCIAEEEERQTFGFKEIYLTEKDFIRIYPNPVSHQLQIDYSNEDFSDFSIRVFNSLGQEMEVQRTQFTTPFAKQTFDLDVSDWAAGTYFITINGTDKDLTTTFVKI